MTQKLLFMANRYSSHPKMVVLWFPYRIELNKFYICKNTTLLLMEQTPVLYHWLRIFYGGTYSGVKCVCGITLSVYPHRASWKICLTTVGIEPATFGLLVQCSTNSATKSSRFECVIFRNSVKFLPCPRTRSHVPFPAWSGNFLACSVWIYTQSNTTNTFYTWAHNTIKYHDWGCYEQYLDGW